MMSIYWVEAIMLKKQYLKERCLFYASGKIHWICSFICEPNIAMCGKFLIKPSSVCMYLEKLKFPLLESTECLMYLTAPFYHVQVSVTHVNVYWKQAIEMGKMCTRSLYN